MRIPSLVWFPLLPLLALLLGIDVALVSGVCQSDQLSLLIRLNNSLIFNQSKSTKLVRWNLNADCCNWPGVTCDEGGLGHIIGLNLSNESISRGIESSSIFSFQYLQNLDLSYNLFNISLPSGFANLTGLISLNLSNAGFWGQIPTQISQMRNLVTLDLSTLYFPGVRSLKLEKPNLATLIQNLTQLRGLLLDGVNISAKGEEWCSTLSLLPNLEVLSLANCYLSGPISASLASLGSLRVIRLDSNNLSAPVPDFFSNFSNLRILRLSFCELKGTFPAEVFEVSTLEILDVSYNQQLRGYLPDSFHNASLRILLLTNTNFSGILPESLGKPGNLSIINLAACNFSGSIPSSMENLTEIEDLDFSYNMFTGQIPSFGSSENLKYIDFSHNNLSGEIPSSHFQGIPNLISVNLRYNSLRGNIPSSLFAVPSLQKILLSSNQFEGQVPKFSNASLSSLDTLDLSSNKLDGLIPISVFNLSRLNVLSLSGNKFNGTIQLDLIQKLGNLTNLDLSYNNLTVESASPPNSLSFPLINTLKLASCNLRVFPNLHNQSKIINLDLSDNHIAGVIPSWIWNVGNGSLRYLNLSHNLLEDLQKPYAIPNLGVLDLHDNRLQGRIPAIPQYVAYVDYSCNGFNSTIPDDIGANLSGAVFFSLSGNHLTGVIPLSICNATNLQVLDFSGNNLTGRIPDCVINMSQNLRVLNLRGNSFAGNIPDNFSGNCLLKTLDLNGNRLGGKIPESLANCSMLEVLNLGSNTISDAFPCRLRTISSLRVLVLRDNKFYGPIICPSINITWARLQIVDVSSNNFSGRLPNSILKTWKAMKGDGNEIHDHLKFEILRLTQLYYQDSVTVTSKGLEMELVKILTVFTSIDVSNNKFDGPIPEGLGQFDALYVLNLSHNALEGQIPPSLGSISHLESLDLSRNNLTGEIPQQLAMLTFLSFLNLSFNMLEGRIPTSTQLQSFAIASFEGNRGLCGAPLDNCININASPPAKQRTPGNGFDWQFIAPGLGFGLGAGAVVGFLLFWKKANKWCDDRIDKVLVGLLPMLGLTYYTRDDWRIAPEEPFEEETTDIDDDEEEENDFGGRYCVFCTKLDISRKRVIHDPKCTCYHSLPITSDSSSSFSCSDSS